MRGYPLGSLFFCCYMKNGFIVKRLQQSAIPKGRKAGEMVRKFLLPQANSTMTQI